MEEDDDLVDFEDEEDPDGDDGATELGEDMNWPSAIAYVAFFLTIALMWHDCFGRH